MSKVQSVWSKADKFLTLSRKIIINLFTVVVLIVITFSLIGGIGSFFSEEESISTKDKVLWFKPVGVVVDSSSSSSTSLDALILGSTDIQQHELEDLIKVLENAADDKNLAAIYINVSELGMYYASAFEIANAVKNIKDKGKRVIAYGQNFGNNAFLISSQANEIILISNTSLYSYPKVDYKELVVLDVGTTLSVLRSWKVSKSDIWLGLN